MPRDVPSAQRAAQFEDTLTWAEANLLRIITADATRAARGEQLLAEDENSSDDPPARRARARYEELARLEAKALALFYRVSDGGA